MNRVARAKCSVRELNLYITECSREPENAVLVTAVASSTCCAPILPALFVVRVRSFCVTVLPNHGCQVHRYPRTPQFPATQYRAPPSSTAALVHHPCFEVLSSSGPVPFPFSGWSHEEFRPIWKVGEARWLFAVEWFVLHAAHVRP